MVPIYFPSVSIVSQGGRDSMEQVAVEGVTPEVESGGGSLCREITSSQVV